MKLVWSKTGDQLDVDVENQQFVDHWFDQMSSAGVTTLYKLKTFHKIIYHNAIPLLHAIELVNTYLEKFKIDKFKTYTLEDMSLYATLNEIHNHWTYLCAEKKMWMFFSNNAPSVLAEFDYINNGSHNIEKIKVVDCRRCENKKKKNGRHR